MEELYEFVWIWFGPENEASRESIPNFYWMPSLKGLHMHKVSAMSPEHRQSCVGAKHLCRA